MADLTRFTNADEVQVVTEGGNTLGINSDGSTVINLNGANASKSKVMKTSSLVTTATTADQVILTYTVTAGKTFYLLYYGSTSYLTTQPGNSNPINLGQISVESPALRA